MIIRQKQLVGAIGLQVAKMAIAIGVAAVIIAFFRNEIAVISENLQKNRSLAAFYERREEVLSGLREAFAGLGDIDQKIAGSLPFADNILGAVAALEEHAAKHALRQTLDFKLPRKEGDLYRIDFVIVASGRRDDIVEYVKTFEILPYFMGISNMSLLADGGDWEKTSTVTMDAFLYAQ